MADVEKIAAELRAGLDGVTPGPWGVYSEPDVGMFGDVFAGKLGDDDFGPIWNRTRNLEHIARCYPENIRALLDELDRLRDALELISEGRGVCGTCGEFAEGPGSGVTMCDNGYCVWEPQDPQKIAARALSTQVEERE